MSTSDSENVTFFDIAVAVCPECDTPVAESGWYGIDMESDIECYECGNVFNMKKHVVDRAIVRITLSKNGKIKKMGVAEKVDLED
jgi:Zn ribbon nucleic-acid-binding protein